MEQFWSRKPTKKFVIENIWSRKAGIEPATSSLGNWQSICESSIQRPQRAFLAIQNTGVSDNSRKVEVKGILTE